MQPHSLQIKDLLAAVDHIVEPHIASSIEDKTYVDIYETADSTYKRLKQDYSEAMHLYQKACREFGLNSPMVQIAKDSLDMAESFLDTRKIELKIPVKAQKTDTILYG